MLKTDSMENANIAASTSLKPVSGRYEGEMTFPQAGRFFLDLRVDIDPAVDNSPVMNRVSGDFFQVFQTTLPGQASRVARTYIESWIVDHPQVEWFDDHVDIKGDVRFWAGAHQTTTIAIQITLDAQQHTRMATVSLTEVPGAQKSFVCRRISDCCRSLLLEIDVCTSVDKPPFAPRYDTNWRDDRPTNLPQRVLTIESAYRETGVAVTIERSPTLVDDSADPSHGWTPAELHDAMETHFSRFGGTWPNWAMWGLMAGKFEKAGVGGIMFDAAADVGGAGKGPDRQGFAVFRGHNWFNKFVSGDPQDPDQAWALRHFLYTWVHEAGHAFNFLHSWDKGRPDSLSWMNYDWRYDQNNGSGAFWKRFAFRFDDDELIHLRHGNRASVIMGGDPWSSGSHLDAPSLAMTQMEGAAPLELLVRSKGYFDLMEPVLVELRLRNLSEDTPAVIETRLTPEFGGVVVYIQKPDSSIVKFEPVICALAEPETLSLARVKGAEQGTERYSREIFLGYGADGFYFDQPGEYGVRAIYQGLGDVLIPSNTHRIRIGAPDSKEANRAAQDYFSDAVGLSLYLQGSRSPFLEKGVAVIEDMADRYKHSVFGAKLADTLAYGVARPFFRIENPLEPKVVMTSRPDAVRALKLTDTALQVLRKDKDKTLNLAYGRVVRRRAEYHEAAGSPGRAKEELETLRKELPARGANPSALRQYKDLESALASPLGPSSPKRRRAPASRTKRPRPSGTEN